MDTCNRTNAHKYWKSYTFERKSDGCVNEECEAYLVMLGAKLPIMFHNKNTNELFTVHSEDELVNAYSMMIRFNKNIDKIYVQSKGESNSVNNVIDVEFEEIADDDVHCFANSFIKDSQESALDEQIGGTHYKDVAIQPVEYIERNKLGFCAGNVVKYVTRYKDKGGKEDLLKARHYIDLLIELNYGSEE